MKKFVCQYALLRFRPFVETGEFAIVGIALFSADARFFGFRLLQKSTRINSFFSQIDGRIYRNGKKQFQDELDRFSDQMRRTGFDEIVNLEQARFLFGELVRPREAMLHFDTQRIVLADDPEEKLNLLFNHYVARDFVTKEYQEDLLVRSVREVLKGANLGDKYRQKAIGDEDFEVNFPFVAMNRGQPARVIKPLYLAHAESTKVINHGGLWVDKIRRLNKRRTLPLENVLFPITAPEPSSKQYKAFEEIRDDLLEMKVQIVPANDQYHILKFASQV